MVTFSYNHDSRYLKVTYAGTIGPGDITEAWLNFMKTGYQGMGYNILVDMSRADMSAVPMAEVEALMEVTSAIHKKYQITSVKVANYALGPLPFGMARAYEGMAMGSVEQIRTFKDLDEAKAWLDREGDGPDRG